VVAICDLAPPQADLALAELAVEGRIRPLPVLAARLWERV
jgi:hypothetical protein